MLIFTATNAQNPKFGGPFANISFNHHGPSLSIGGGGTFIVKGNCYIGIFGQGTSDVYKRFGDTDFESYLLKSRQTGFWFGYNYRFQNYQRVGASIYNKVGFGQVQLNDSEKSMSYYNKSMIFTPNIELSYQITSFFEIGLAVHYEFFTGVDLAHYTNKDFNSYGASLLFKFKKM